MPLVSEKEKVLPECLLALDKAPALRYNAARFGQPKMVAVDRRGRQA